MAPAKARERPQKKEGNPVGMGGSAAGEVGHATIQSMRGSTNKEYLKKKKAHKKSRLSR